MRRTLLGIALFLIATISIGQITSEPATVEETQITVGRIEMEIDGLKKKMDYWVQKGELTEDEQTWLDQAEAKLVELEKLLATKKEE